MRIDEDEIKNELNLKRFGAQEWFSNKNEGCPFCQGSGKWGVIFNKIGGSFHCWKCGTKTHLGNYLEKIGRKDLWRNTYQNTIKETSLTPLFSEEDESPESGLSPVTLPKRLEPLINDSYLNSRGFTEYHYKHYEPSFTNFILERKLKDYIIFKMKIDGVVVAWLARSKKSKQWHDENLKAFKEGRAKLSLRYENSRTNFTHILGGYDEINEMTETIIIVEGLFDKINIDNLLGLDKIDDIKCVFTFGNSISKEQINLLKKKPSIKQVILMYDDKTEKESKSAGLILQRYFNTKIAYLFKPGIDPGDMDIIYLSEILGNLKDPINFFTDILS